MNDGDVRLSPVRLSSAAAAAAAPPALSRRVVDVQVVRRVDEQVERQADGLAQLVGGLELEDVLAEEADLRRAL